MGPVHKARNFLASKISTFTVYILYIIQVYRSLRVCSEFKEIGKFIVCIYILYIIQVYRSLRVRNYYQGNGDILAVYRI